jgi:FkbM family methyltransferase
MRVHGDLIFDVGVCNGDDSAYYLHKGYRVVGVEANPLMVEMVKRRFRSEIRDGRYHLEPVAIAKTEGEAEFWVCDDIPDWSSFDRSWASNYGARHHSITVKTQPFSSILDRYGTPIYSKIDIEGSDDLCLIDMIDLPSAVRPQYVSVEENHGEKQLSLLHRLGYTRFKIISQLTLRQPPKLLTRLKASMPPLGRRFAIAAEWRLSRRRRDFRWRFPVGSGPFGEATSGDWLTLKEAFDFLERLRTAEHYADWWDIHAARE